MAKMIDKEPQYEGEKVVWRAFSKNLPSDWIVYNTRTVNGREYDFCVIAPNIGLFIVEVKGWYPDSVLTVLDAGTIFLSGAEDPEDSPRSQARGYRFDLLKKIQRELGMKPLVMSFVCYPHISEKDYYDKINFFYKLLSINVSVFSVFGGTCLGEAIPLPLRSPPLKPSKKSPAPSPPKTIIKIITTHTITVKDATCQLVYSLNLFLPSILIVIIKPSSNKP